MSKFIPLGSLLQENTPSLLTKKTIFQEEDIYAPYLITLEETIAEHFLDNQTIKDKHLVLALKNIKEHYNKDFIFFKTPLEKKLMQNLSTTLQEKSITHHEFSLVIKYILWSINNRSWMQNSRAYLQWICYFLGYYNEQEEIDYVRDVQTTVHHLHLPEEYSQQLLMKEGDEKNVPTISKVLEDEQKAVSEFFCLEEHEKGDYLLTNLRKDLGFIEENKDLFTDYMLNLEERADYEQAIHICKQLLDIVPEYPPFEVSLAMFYRLKGDLPLAEKHIEHAKQNTLSSPDIFPKRDMKFLLTMIKLELKLLEKAKKREGF